MPSRASVAVALLLAACSGGEARLRAAPASAAYEATGLASWYGEEVAGNRTASGERFDPGGLTAAHRTLPFGTLVEITLLDTGRSVVARVNDRGPGRRDRLIDLSRGAAQRLGLDRHPLSPVRIRVLAAGAVATRTAALLGAAAPIAPGRYWLQVASFSDPDRAAALAARLNGEVVAAGRLYRVRLGPLNSARAAERARDAAAAQGYGDARLIPIPVESSR